MQARAGSSESFPWYDSQWLAAYRAAEVIVDRVDPTALAGFRAAFDVLRTRKDFEPPLLTSPFDDATRAEIRQTVASLRPMDLELHEARRFGRFVVHDHPSFTRLQERAVRLVSEAVGEPVEPAYNFLSLYSGKGVCAVHMDAPEAKWTFDLCLDQSAPWPIHFSQVLDWPDLDGNAWGVDWEEKIKRSPAHRFTSYALEPGQAVVFSGSSQWHYRDSIPSSETPPFCHLLFLHYIPRGTAELIRPKNWARIFGVAELAQIAEGRAAPTSPLTSRTDPDR